jgi:hypothetical protein
MKDIIELVPRVHEVAAAAPEPTVIRHLRDAAREFCRRTRIWRTTESWTLGTGACEVVAVDQETELFEISHAKLGETDLEAKTIDWLDKERPGWRAEEGTARIITQVSPKTVRVTPKPEIDDDNPLTLTLELILLPSHDTERLPDPLIDTYAQMIADGALGRVLALPSDFAQPDLAAVHARAFETALGRWGNLVPRGQMKAKRRVKPAKSF